MGGHLMSSSEDGTLSDNTTTCSKGLDDELHNSSRRVQTNLLDIAQ